MSGYAPNPTYQSPSEPAQLSAGLLARKGEALPAVDAQVFAGVDIETQIRPVRPGDKRAKEVNDRAVGSLYQLAEPVAPGTPRNVDFKSKVVSSQQNVTIKPPAARDAWFSKRKKRAPLAATEGPKAVVTYRMPANEFLRLRRASKELEMTCQAIILDALDCYLDAYEIPAVSMAEAKREAALMARKRK
ncbi:MAG: hypothetical protein KJN99_00630 [Marinicaulis sp.]|nr:hypothetical protein [Marinicaulis sp.]